ncbi:hypothetical protein EV363DRAFT_1300361 [Boletus edulis]|nr:hypothetical protein EV363DRAFT_1300361 [Boletus edulis]
MTIAIPPMTVLMARAMLEITAPLRPWPMSTPYDINFCFPVRELENDRPARHADLFFRGFSPYGPLLFQHVPSGPFSSATAFTEQFVHARMQANPANMLYAIIDKTRTPRSSNGTDAPPSSTDFAGTIAYFFGSPTHLSIEIGFAIILPPFQRTHVTTNAVGLLLRYALDLPTASPPGLGLRRVQWQTSEKNEVSIRVAERMGLKREGILRWDRVYMDGQGKAGTGEDIREGDPMPGTSCRHTVMLAICWDDWENGGREQVARLMDR